MTIRSLLAATALVLPACAGTAQELRAPAGAAASVPTLELHAPHGAFPAIIGNADLPSADAVAMHMQHVLGDSASADVRVCVDGTGRVEKASLLKSSGLGSYDAGVLADVRAWRFEAPAQASCADLTVVYALRD
jgi:TonB family protein